MTDPLADRLAEWPDELRRGAKADGGFLGSPPPITPEQAEALADTLDEAVEALRKKDRRIAKAISYANSHDYRGNRPRWMNDIPAILGGTDD